MFIGLLLVPKNNNAQDDKSVVLTVSGQGNTQEEARKKALRSAIEQAFGSFISSKTEILNDNLVKDEIVSVSNGNIQKFEPISEVQLPDGGYASTLKATVSISKLTSFCEGKGVEIEFKGSLLAFNLEQQILNEKNEVNALKELNKVCRSIFNKSFDYKVNANEPKVLNENNINIKLEIDANFNGNINLMRDYLIKTINNLSMHESEIESYKKVNKPIYKMAIGPCELYKDTIYRIYSIDRLGGVCGDVEVLKTDKLKEFEKAKKKYPMDIFYTGQDGWPINYRYVKTPLNCNVKYVFRSSVSIFLVNDIIFYTLNSLFNFEINSGQKSINGQDLLNCYLNLNSNPNCRNSVSIQDNFFSPILTGGDRENRRPTIENVFPSLLSGKFGENVLSDDELKNINTNSKFGYRSYKYISQYTTIKNRLDYRLWHQRRSIDGAEIINVQKEYRMSKAYNFLSLLDLDIPCEEAYFSVISLFEFKENNSFKIFYDLKLTLDEVKKVSRFKISSKN